MHLLAERVASMGGIGNIEPVYTLDTTDCNFESR